MPTISNRLINEKRSDLKPRFQFPFWDRYMAYAAKQEGNRIIWYALVLLVIPCVFMVLFAFAMYMLTPYYTWFLGWSVVMFYANVLSHVAQTKSTFYIPLFHATLLIFVLLPIVVLFSGFLGY